MSKLPNRNSRNTAWTGHPSYDPKRDDEFHQMADEVTGMMGAMVGSFAKSKVGKGFIALWLAGVLLSIAAVVVIIVVLLHVL
jgi:hypothetical protein